MDPALQAALVAAGVTIVGIFVRDYALAHIAERRERQHTELAVYRSYANPLAEATSSLFWRLNEIFDDARASTTSPSRRPTTSDTSSSAPTTASRASSVGYAPCDASSSSCPCRNRSRSNH